MRRRILLILLLALLGSCGGLPKQGPAPALYDFGLVSANPERLPVKLGQVEAAPELDRYDMRYRLAYQNPAQVFAYTESRWAALPADLVMQRMQNQWLPAYDAKCTLNISLDEFDQVFDSPKASRSVVQLRGELVHGSGRTARRDSTVVKIEKASPSADAKGGVAALTAATDAAIASLKIWINEQQCEAPSREK